MSDFDIKETKKYLDFNEVEASKEQSIVLNNKEYRVYFSIRVGELSDVIKCVNNDFEQLDDVIYELISSYFIGNKELTEEISDEDIESIIYLHLKFDEQLNDSWNSIDEKSLKKKYLLAIKNYAIITTANMLKECIPDPQVIIDGMMSFLKKFSEIIVPFLNKINDAINNLIQNIQLPEIDADTKLQLKESYITWGKYGWTVIPNAPICFFNNAPIDINQADRMAMHFCNKINMKEYFSSMRKEILIKQDDLEEAIFNFENKKYKSCVMILFSMIDSKLINLQRDEDRTGKNQYRRTGANAARKIKERVQKEQDIERKILALFIYENIFTCLMKMFENGNDFQVEPKVINRNFIDHGMSLRRVNKKDCVQVFLLYMNLIKFLNLIEEV